VLAAALVSAGCGGGDDETTSGGSTTAPTTTGAQQEATGGDHPGAPPLGPAEARESVGEAQDRIAEAISSGDCDAINELNPLSRPALDTPERCEFLKRLDGLQALGAEEYGDAGAVIDYEGGVRTISAVLIRDEDGLFHIAFLNAFNDYETVDTPYAKQFDAVAKQAIEALERGDCPAYEKAAFRRFGRGSLDPASLCDYAKANPIGNLIEAQPDAKLERAGGSDAYAFFTLGTPGLNMTLVFAREQEQGAPPEAAELPADAAKYGYVDVYRTNARASG
jgi:hypothetical protein